MWPMTFLLPSGLPHEVAQQMQWSCLAGGPDNMPWPTSIQLNGNTLTLSRQAEESGYLMAPWLVEGYGLLMGTSATLMLRPNPYQLVVELARGKVNQVRCQSSDWQAGGLQVPAELHALVRQASQTFGHAVCAASPEETFKQASQAMVQGYQAATALVEAYIRQVFQIRHQRNDRLVLGSRLDLSVTESASLAAQFKQSFNRAVVPLSWHVVEAEETVYKWDQYDAMIAWAEDQELDITAGPLVDFSSSQLPAWLWLWEQDSTALTAFMCRYVEAAVRRYRSRIRRWQLTAASNWASVLGLSENELLGLTFRLGEAARGVDPSLELVVGISQPWGEQMATVDRESSPFIFADNLIRSGLQLAGLNIEVVMGAKGRGSYCRDILETSRILDLYALLGVPLQVTLGYPADSKPDPDADPEMSVEAGHWQKGYTPEAQADWARVFTELALCKPFVHSVQWTHFSDQQPHLFPNCGLVDAEGKARAALAALKKLRDTHVR